MWTKTQNTQNTQKLDFHFRFFEQTEWNWLFFYSLLEMLLPIRSQVNCRSKWKKCRYIYHREWIFFCFFPNTDRAVVLPWNAIHFVRIDRRANRLYIRMKLVIVPMLQRCSIRAHRSRHRGTRRVYYSMRPCHNVRVYILLLAITLEWRWITMQ